jgi:hypothetical protein
MPRSLPARTWSWRCPREIADRRSRASRDRQRSATRPPVHQTGCGRELIAASSYSRLKMLGHPEHETEIAADYVSRPSARRLSGDGGCPGRMERACGVPTAGRSLLLEQAPCTHPDASTGTGEAGPCYSWRPSDEGDTRQALLGDRRPAWSDQRALHGQDQDRHTRRPCPAQAPPLLDLHPETEAPPPLAELPALARSRWRRLQPAFGFQG